MTFLNILFENSIPVSHENTRQRIADNALQQDRSGSRTDLSHEIYSPVPDQGRAPSSL